MAIIKVADLGISSGVATPAFEAFRSSNQTGLSSDDTFYKIQCDAEIYDTDGCYDNSTNYRFTPTVAGKYFLYAKVTVNDGSVTTTSFDIAFYKNGTRFTSNFIGADADYYPTVSGCHTVNANGSTDYFEVYVRWNQDASGIHGSSSNIFTNFGGFRIIGA